MLGNCAGETLAAALKSAQGSMLLGFYVCSCLACLLFCRFEITLLLPRPACDLRKCLRKVLITACPSMSSRTSTERSLKSKMPPKRREARLQIWQTCSVWVVRKN